MQAEYDEYFDKCERANYPPLCFEDWQKRQRMAMQDVEGVNCDPTPTYAEAWRAPAIQEGETLLLDAPGRLLPPEGTSSYGTDCRSHYYRLVMPRFGASPILRVKHGGGEQHYTLDSFWMPPGLTDDPEAAYRFLRMLYDTAERHERRGRERTGRLYSEAFAEGRLKKRKGKNGTKVWVETPVNSNGQVEINKQELNKWHTL